MGSDRAGDIREDMVDISGGRPGKGNGSLKGQLDYDVMLDLSEGTQREKYLTGDKKEKSVMAGWA